MSGLNFNKKAIDRRRDNLAKAQAFVDSEVLRGCAKYVPFRTGNLIKSGTLGTKIGSGKVRYIAPYSRRQYYTNKGKGQRGKLWFERWKTENRKQVLAAADKIAKGEL